MSRPSPRSLRRLTASLIGATVLGVGGAFVAGQASGDQDASSAEPNARRLVDEGRQIFRYETFGDEQLWTGVLGMHEVIAGVSPRVALGKGLKVDVDALPAELVAKLRAGTLDLDDPANTVALIGLDAVVGVRGTVSSEQKLTSLGITCALCHSTVDDSFDTGIGKRLDGWANPDLDVGAIVALSPALDPDTRDVFNSWGPGMYDPRHHAFDGTSIVPLQPQGTPSIPVVIPAIYGLRGVGWETYTGDGPISYWNSYVGVGQMGGQGSFSDPRIDLTITQAPDLVTPLLPALLAYQLSLRTPEPPEGSYDRAAARRGKRLFNGVAGCDACHRAPDFTDVRRGRRFAEPFLHDPAETGMDPGYAERSATKRYRATPLRALWQHAPYFHDGSAADLPAVVDHYDAFFGLALTGTQKQDLVEYLKSL